MRYIEEQLSRLVGDVENPHKIKLRGGGSGETNYLNITRGQLADIKRILIGRRDIGKQPRYGVRIVDSKGNSSYLEYRGRSKWCLSSARQHRRDWLAVNPKTEARIEEL